MSSANRVQINFEAIASLRKWPSIGGQRNDKVRFPSPYVVIEGTLGECLSEFMAKSKAQQHLYEIHTAPQEQTVTEVIHAEHAAELNRLRDFL